MDVLDHLIEEHRKAEGMIKKLVSSEEGSARNETLAELIDALNTHMAVEEHFVYPIVESALGKDKREGADTEHDLARAGLNKANELVDKEGFKAAVEMIKAGIDHHVQEEETDIFPKLRQKAGKQIEALGDPEELELAVKSRDDLMDKAKELDITGRSSMSKDELADAIAKAD